ncbi:hypothetical protein F183_A54010 [Bryobacterales bacterium F-183]|nr:hypothetical protein F183_A54010 [Bryobacterales bacterium F-183]
MQALRLQANSNACSTNDAIARATEAGGRTRASHSNEIKPAKPGSQRSRVLSSADFNPKRSTVDRCICLLITRVRTWHSSNNACN